MTSGSENRQRDRLLCARCTKEEAHAIRAAAKAAGMSVSQYMRLAAFHQAEASLAWHAMNEATP